MSTRLNEYQNMTSGTAVYNNPDKEDIAFETGLLPLMYAGLGCAGEGGEVADQIKKMYRDGKGITDEHREKIKLELGDNMWYIAQIARMLGFTLEEIMDANIEKLKTRYDR